MNWTQEGSSISDGASDDTTHTLQVDFVTLQQQRRSRFVREGGSTSWLTSQRVKVATVTLTAVSKGSLGRYADGRGAVVGQAVVDMLGGGLIRSIQGLDLAAGRAEVGAARPGEVGVLFEVDRGGGGRAERALAGKIILDQPRPGWRTVKGRTVRLTFLLRDTHTETMRPMCDVLVPVLQDGSCAMTWEEFWARFRALTRGLYTANRFAYSPKPGLMLSTGGLDHTPQCLKGYPHVNISKVEDDMSEGVCAMPVSERLDMLQRARRAWRDHDASSIVCEVALLFDSARNYHVAKDVGDAKEAKESQQSSLGILTRALRKALAPAWGRARDGGGSVEEFASIIAIYDVGDGAKRRAWTVVKVATDDAKHAQALISILALDKEISLVEDSITADLRKREEDRALAEKGKYVCLPVAARLHRRMVGDVPWAFYRFSSQIKDDVARLQEVGRSSGGGDEGWHCWRGICLRYEGNAPWEKRHEVLGRTGEDGAKAVYTYIDAYGHVLYSSDGTVLVQNLTDLSAAVRGEVMPCCGQCAGRACDRVWGHVRSLFMGMRLAVPGKAQPVVHRCL